MPDDDRCVHDMLPGQCAFCTGRDGGARAEAQRRARLLSRADVWEATYRTACADCGETITPGDPIKRSRKTGWIGPCCIEETRR